MSKQLNSTIYDDNSITAIPLTEIVMVDENSIVGTTPVVGEYELKFKYKELSEYVVTLNVNPKELAVPTAEAMVYSGEMQTASLEGFDEETMTLSGDLSATNANTYVVSVSLKDKTNYCWTGGSTTDKDVEYTISKMKFPACDNAIPCLYNRITKIQSPDLSYTILKIPFCIF